VIGSQVRLRFNEFHRITSRRMIVVHIQKAGGGLFIGKQMHASRKFLLKTPNSSSGDDCGVTSFMAACHVLK